MNFSHRNEWPYVHLEERDDLLNLNIGSNEANTLSHAIHYEPFLKSKTVFFINGGFSSLNRSAVLAIVYGNYTCATEFTMRMSWAYIHTQCIICFYIQLLIFCFIYSYFLLWYFYTVYKLCANLFIYFSCTHISYLIYSLKFFPTLIPSYYYGIYAVAWLKHCTKENGEGSLISSGSSECFSL